MQQHEIHHYLERYFTANECTILENDSGYLSIQLTIEMDKLLMNRPFYWHYLERTGGKPNPMQLTLITNQNKIKEDIKGEVVHFGSPRLHQIFKSAKNLGAYTRMYEQVDQPVGQQVSLQPWLCLNSKISYQCDRKKDIILSLGLNLINGMVLKNFQERMTAINLTPKIPDFCFTLSPLIKPKSGVKRLEQLIERMIQDDNHDWAEEARERWLEDEKLLDHFYEEEEEKPESYLIEKEALKEQYEPKINVTFINGGLFYLSPKALNK